MSEVKMIQMKIGENFGQLMSDIAREKMAEFDLEGALRFLTESLHGMSNQEAFDVAIGLRDLNTIDQELEMVPGVKGLIEFNERRDFIQKNIAQQSKDFNRSLEGLSGRGEILRFTDMDITFNRADIIRCINENDMFGIKQTIADNEKASDIANIVNTISLFVVRSLKAKKFYSSLEQYGIKLDITIDPAFNKLGNYLSRLRAGDSISYFDMKLDTPNNIMLDTYLDASRDIMEISKNGIKECDISTFFNAGWISPKGEYFALNGTIANLLHVQIADMLLESGYFGKVDDDFVADLFMSKDGWIKVHGDKVSSDLGFTNKLTITQEQINALVKYTKHHDTLIIGRTPLTASKIKIADVYAFRKMFRT